MIYVFCCLRGRSQVFLHYDTMILQHISIIVEDAGFEVWCATNEQQLVAALLAFTGPLQGQEIMFLDGPQAARDMGIATTVMVFAHLVWTTMGEARPPTFERLTAALRAMPAPLHGIVVRGAWPVGPELDANGPSPHAVSLTPPYVRTVFKYGAWESTNVCSSFIITFKPPSPSRSSSPSYVFHRYLVGKAC